MDEQPKLTRQDCARLGGLAVSRNREHMAAIGSKGGQKVSTDRAWMSEIGQRGGRRSNRRHRPQEAADGEAQAVDL